MSMRDKLGPRVAAGEISSIDARRVLPRKSGIEQLLETWERQEALIRGSLFGPLQQLRIWDGHLKSEMDHLRGAVTAFQARFHVPTEPDVISRLREFYENLASEDRRRRQDLSVFCNAALRMQSPWLDMQEPWRSISGLSGLHGIGEVLQSGPAFGPELSETLRLDLGDWRKKIAWPTEIFTDLGVRADFYVDLGFNADLTYFPEEAFRECLRDAGIFRERPSLAESYGMPVAAAEKAEEEEGFDRNNQAHDWLQRLETQIRQFIDKMMTEEFGPDWPKHRLPNGVHEQWRDRKQQEAMQGRSGGHPLIAYADFTDYERVICKRDNWRVFEPFFHSRESVRESFQRLYPIRVDTMHARPINQDDELLLYVESRRLIGRIGKGA